MMNYSKKIKCLNNLYLIYEEIEQNSSIACKKGCNACCTVNVTLTTLEYAYIHEKIENQSLLKSIQVKNKIENILDKKRYLPKITINKFAEMCMNRKTPPEEENNPRWGVCPFLEDSCCKIYQSRPFACRCMSSKVKCEEGGSADMDDFNLNINNAFMQYLEQIDQGGFTSNLSDMIDYFGRFSNYSEYKAGKTKIDRKTFILNQKIPLLLIPPQYHTKAELILKKLYWD